MTEEHLSEEVRQERLMAALRLSGQLDKSGRALPGADPHLLIPRKQMRLRREGGRIVSEGAYHVDAELQEKFLRMRRALARSKRFFILHGPPGSGKDRFMEEVAAGAYMPYRFFNLGGNTDLNQIKGGDGILPRPLYQTRRELARNIDGEELRGGAGEKLWEEKQELLGAIPQTEEILGEIVRWMQEPSVVVLQEPEGQQEDMVQFHSALGDRLGDSSGRKIFIDSMHGSVHAVHPDCIVAITHNARKAQGDFVPATKDRAVHFSFDYPPPEIEAERLARATETIMRSSGEMYPELARHYSSEDLLPWARALESLRLDLDGSALGFRTAADAFCEMVQSAYEGSEDPFLALLGSLEFLYLREFPSSTQRAEHLASILADHRVALSESALRLAGH